MLKEPLAANYNYINHSFHVNVLIMKEKIKHLVFIIYILVKEIIIANIKVTKVIYLFIVI